jgi:hypothetical protein
LGQAFVHMLNIFISGQSKGFSLHLSNLMM